MAIGIHTGEPKLLRGIRRHGRARRGPHLPRRARRPDRGLAGDARPRRRRRRATPSRSDVSVATGSRTCPPLKSFSSSSRPGLEETSLRSRRSEARRCPRSTIASSAAPRSRRGQALLARADVRLVTITGPGGAGKSRLALEAAAAAAVERPVHLVGLALHLRPALVPAAIARVVGVRESPAAALPNCSPTPSRAPARSSCSTTSSI